MKNRDRRMFPENWPAKWPSYLPYPTAIRRGPRSVPNVNSVTWPQSQFAPRRLPPGFPSFQPYTFPDGPWVTPPYTHEYPPALGYLGDADTLRAVNEEDDAAHRAKLGPGPVDLDLAKLPSWGKVAIAGLGGLVILALGAHMVAEVIRR